MKVVCDDMSLQIVNYLQQQMSLLMNQIVVVDFVHNLVSLILLIFYNMKLITIGK